MTITLDEFTNSMRLDSSVRTVINTIASTSKVVASIVRKSTLKGNIGVSGDVNHHGEDVQKLDHIANETFVQSLSHCEYCSCIVSEEMKEPLLLDNEGPYMIAIDPLDGSSNIDVNVTIGTIFGVYKDRTREKSQSIVGIRDLRISGYVMYGSATIMVLSFNNTVYMFTFSPDVGEYFLTSSNLKMPEQGNTFSINEGNTKLWTNPGLKSWVDSCKNVGMSARYVGSMIADCHRTLLKGGVFVYPEDNKNTVGKLRMLYEAIPIAHIFESAGGAARTMTGKRILDVEVVDVHQRAPIVLGSIKNVEDLFRFTS